MAARLNEVGDGMNFWSLVYSYRGDELFVQQTAEKLLIYSPSFLSTQTYSDLRAIYVAYSRLDSHTVDDAWPQGNDH